MSPKSFQLVILSAGEAGARDRTTAYRLDAVSRIATMQGSKATPSAAWMVFGGRQVARTANALLTMTSLLNA